METINHNLEQAPLPQVVENLATAIANAQVALDRHSIAVARMMAEPMPAEDGVLAGRSMLELGFTPTFYHFTETTITAKVAFSSTQTIEKKVSGGITLGYSIVSASVNASYSNKYSFTAEGSSEITTKIVSLPPPSALSRLIDAADRDRTKG